MHVVDLRFPTRRQHRPQFRAHIICCRAVDVLLVRPHREPTGGIAGNAGNRHAVRVQRHEIRRVDEAGEMIDAGDDAQTELVRDQRQVDDDFAVLVQAAGMGRGRYLASRLGIERIELRWIGNEAQRSAERAGAIQRALRPTQHFNTLQIAQMHREEDGRLAEIGGDRRNCRIGIAAAIDCLVRVQAAQDEVVIVAHDSGTRVHESQARHEMREVGKIHDTALFQRGAGIRGNIVRHFLHRLAAAGGSDDHFLDLARGCVLREGKRRKTQCRAEKQQRRQSC